MIETVLKFRGVNPELVPTLRMALTALTSLRCLRLPPEIDLEPIEEEGKDFPLPTPKVLAGFWKELGFNVTKVRSPTSPLVE